jgi:hypothetical protein
VTGGHSCQTLTNILSSVSRAAVTGTLKFSMHIIIIVVVKQQQQNLNEKGKTKNPNKNQGQKMRMEEPSNEKRKI